MMKLPPCYHLTIPLLSPYYPLTINLARKGLFVIFLYDDSFFICIFLHNAICSNN